MSVPESAEFSFTWQAMKLLGKSLYSNPWAAISELVANGFDANARNVWILLDLSDGKTTATLEVLDDGCGMDRRGIQDYVQVGRNRRISDISPLEHPMGRKGIGKLAALYLSNEFYLATKSSNESSIWHLSVDESMEQEQRPALRRFDGAPPFSLEAHWDQQQTGTILSIRNIDLRGTGDAALRVLGPKLANQFLLSSMDSRQIWLCVRKNRTDQTTFSPVEKYVAFKNYMLTYTHFDQRSDCPAELSGTEASDVHLLVGDVETTVPVQRGDLIQFQSRSKDHALAGTIDLVIPDGSTRKFEYSLTGWLAVHATIKPSLAKINDSRFEKNPFYNPAQIRLYVRNKLASENILHMLGITQAYANYIEGEISFDLLDEDNLPDIATTNRQGFDENDPRVEQLQRILKPLVRGLIREREKVITGLRDRQQQAVEGKKARAKKAFLQEVRQDFETAGIDRATADDLLIPMSNKLSGDALEPKIYHKVFLSHSRKDKGLLDFIYYLLMEKGAMDDEIFYTSKDKNPSDPVDLRALTKLMRENIVDVKTRILYVTSPGFGKSMYCLFEGGAGWATRAIGDFDLLTTNYSDAPVFLHNGNTLQNLMNSSGCIELTQDVYSEIVRALNHLVDHLNSGREILGSDEFIERFSTDDIPPSHRRSGKPITSFMDPAFVDLWNEYVQKQGPWYSS